MGHICILCCNEVTLGGLLNHFRMGAGPSERPSHDEKLETQPHSLGRGEKLESELITDHTYIMKLPLKFPNYGFWRALGW